MKQKIKRFTAFVVLCTLAVSCAVPALGARKSDIDGLKQQCEALEQQRQELRAQIDDAQFDQLSVTEKCRMLDDQVMLTQQIINNVNRRISASKELIGQYEDTLLFCQQQEESQWQLYKSRLRSLEESGILGYLGVIFGARNVTDFVNRLHCLREIISYDAKVYDDLGSARTRTEKAEAALNAARQELASEKEELKVLRNELVGQVNDASAPIVGLESDADAFLQLEEDLIGEMDTLQDEADVKVAQLDEQRRREQEARIKEGTEGGEEELGTGDYIWPCPACEQVTALFGTRWDDTIQYYKTHYGIDVGASYGDSVFAVDKGVVIAVGYCAAYGNYVVLYHGSSTTTLYAHLSQTLVKEGETLKRGHLLGYAGNSGAVNAPCLHFEVSVNGTRLNPLDRFADAEYEIA